MIKRLKNNYIQVVFLATIIFSLGSCKSKSNSYGNLYNPSEVAYLSEILDIPLSNKDKTDDMNISLLYEVSTWLNVPYRYGGNSKKGVDCSGLVHQVYKKVYNLNLPRTTATLYSNKNKLNESKLRTGDLIFFATGNNKSNPTHVGIYLKENRFIHASTSKGVIVSLLSEKYYKQRMLKGVRILP